jgi:hypothetical protein
MIDGARSGGELEAAFVALVEFAVWSALASLAILLALGCNPRYPQGFT